MGKYSDNLFRKGRERGTPSRSTPTSFPTRTSPARARMGTADSMCIQEPEVLDDRNSYEIVVSPHPSKYPKHEGSKGSVFGGVCNRTACSRPNSKFYNIATRGYYCREDAHAINWDRTKPSLCVAVDHDLTHDEMNALYDNYTW